MAKKQEQTEPTIHPDIAAAQVAIAEKKEQKRFMLESNILERIVYDDEGKLLVRFRQGRAEVNKKDYERCQEHRHWGKNFGDVGMLRNAATARQVEVQVR